MSVLESRGMRDDASFELSIVLVSTHVSTTVTNTQNGIPSIDTVVGGRRGVRRTARFVRRHGARFEKVAVVGTGFSLQYVRLIVNLARMRKVRVFETLDQANQWLELVRSNGPE